MTSNTHQPKEEQTSTRQIRAMELRGGRDEIGSVRFLAMNCVLLTAHFFLEIRVMHVQNGASHAALSRLQQLIARDVRTLL